ncbi:plant intracellular Ras-group-related LRR protein 8 [Phoenix dactylifera]|uniref:Plant intracellular Ras-group-related LRR protein 8 n=1 Tax=Phoenix dactylifera TaxID=42345 RepID=A0A8B9A3K9_PHODC|nr:plant intracellular Ras-group-related LRR protein 8 [Phoenix dactylifera]XP_038980247.1 plant intracellular Ras-group-related LRR protein 8 [Phoenix dactylifera]
MEVRGDAALDPTTITVHVKFSGRTLPLSVSDDSTVRDLKSLLQPLTNVIPRGQKLIFKGKVLADTMKLKSEQVIDGSKVMLIASQGLHQGDGPITKVATLPSTNTRRILDSKPSQVYKAKTIIDKSRSEHWKITGVVGLSWSHLKTVPEEVWACGHYVRVLDISNNFIQEIPDKISLLTSLNKLLLNANDLLDKGISWEGLSSLKSLTVLSLSQNHFTTLPSVVGTLTSLCELHIANNKLTSLPAEIGFLNQLQILKAGNNRISSLPSSIGNCHSLVEIDLSLNLLVELPETLGNLRNLKALHLRNNGLKSLPSTLFKMCSQLSTLDLHGTEITNDFLRQVEGWEYFDERRRSKHQKQLDFHVGSSGVFDEGADDNRGS